MTSVLLLLCIVACAVWLVASIVPGPGARGPNQTVRGFARARTAMSPEPQPAHGRRRPR